MNRSILPGACLLLLLAVSCTTLRPEPAADLPPGWPDPGPLLREARKPGAVLAAFDRTGDVRTAAWGWADLEARRPVTADTPFILASVSKLFVGVAVLQLVEQGRLDLDSDIGTWLGRPVRNPRFPDVPLTLRMLLTHRSGIQNDLWLMFGQLMGPGDPPEGALDDFVENYLMAGGRWYKASNFAGWKPGTGFEYSNPGICLAAYLVERVSGLPFPEYCQRALFEPLGMGRTSWFSPASGPSPAVPYTSFLGLTVRKGYYSAPFYPAGFLKTTAADLGRFGAAVLAGGELGGRRILGKAALEAMLADQPGPPPDHWQTQGLVWQGRTVEGRRLTGHTGGLDGISSLFLLDLAGGRGALVLTNGSWLDGTGYDRLSEAPMRRLALGLLDL